MFYSILIAYLMGSVPWALLLARWLGAPDPRRLGSGNPGAANMMRGSGPGPALVVAVLDAAKGTASVVVAQYLDRSAAPAAAVAAIVGHIYPVWLGFKGGKGVATACGAFGVLAPTATAVSLAVFVAVVWRTGFASAGSLLAAVALPPMAYATGRDGSTLVASLLAAGLIVARHRGNLVRLCAGTERPLRRVDVGSSERPETTVTDHVPGRIDRSAGGA